jgi:hypothetical protein
LHTRFLRRLQSRVPGNGAFSVYGPEEGGEWLKGLKWLKELKMVEGVENG